MGKVCNMEKILSVLENIKGYLPLIRLADLLDVAIVAYLVYKLLSLVKSTRAANILKGVAIFLAALWLSSKLNLRVVNYILSHMVEWGVLAGLNFPHFSTSGPDFGIDNRLGWQAGLQIGLKFRYFTIGPEVLYVRQSIKLSHADYGTLKIKTNSIDIPLIFSLRALPMLRINVGPVFTVMNDCKYAEGNNEMFFGSMRPTVSYMLGLGLNFGHTLIDFRYNGQFDSKKCYYPTEEAVGFNMRSYSLALSVGFVF